MVSAIILAGGYATRLRPLSLTKPKALFPLLNRPIIRYTLDSLIDSDVNDIYLSLRVMADKIINYLKNSNLLDKVKIEVENEPLGDAGPLRVLSEKYNLDEDVIVIYGDVFSEVNIKSLLDFYYKKSCDAVIVGVEVDDPRRYGVLYTENDILVELIEKPRRPISNLINGGIYIFKKELFESIRVPSSISRNFLPNILKSNKCIAVYKYSGIWADIGVPDDYLKLNFKLLIEKYPKGYIGPSAKVSESSTLIPPYYIGQDNVIKEDAYLSSHTILGDNVKIGRGCYISESILMNNVEVKDYTFVTGSIIADKSRIGKWNHVLEGSILGEEVITGDGILINKGTIILPNKEVNEPIYDRDKIIL
ncbi:mannose-1-phosphate guanylyltransferase [Sulfolobus sp. A20]|uniref:sugar phosphate nucleotidyltransferase n=1 Tax=Saccharolobus sp. A20 TaxID=1891280 RepID=UPI0008461363|nr:NDP-sugar synthase [Sulfolobus sp. A20]TRM75080.1 mannose-1-phosphate guanylyltransferase [Sulfolobus sp. E5]TRM76631.1 mannose-1-phosphate guanylyltransferase [Sulfolobus sp. A20-N-F8]TRM83365.1 mannose-1-phosphate guanylyltransferase [Sulfolobus sp. A20-N-F6]TRM84852.1 mannose-1-phosphate guanylyltransferase [Sulfolobus sp. F3]TRM87349.1 mannose-1-phosphate guanylyltransferase [Sulfolobus sp. C3]TRM93795.1 mannose-1-phosphate guanylyltransferase [Sulfolobus sp. A20-N-G8]